MAETVFFSWQVDTPPGVGRNFIERALERALGRLNEKLQLDEPERSGLVIDRDTKGVAGQPPIVETIFKKIDAAAVFIPDLTFVGNRIDGRPTPNPNVLVEYGWALKTLGHGRVVPVMNTAFGAPTGNAMPFDMRHLRNPFTYELPVDAPEERRTQERERLSKMLEDAIGTVLSSSGSRAAKLVEAYVPTPTANSQARFREAGVALGVNDRSFDFEKPSEVFLADGPAVWLRLMPIGAPGRIWTSVELRKAATQDAFLLGPLWSGYGSLGYLRGNDGFGVYANPYNNSKATSLTFAFETGEVWGIDAYVVTVAISRGGDTGRAGIPYLEGEFAESLSRYSRYLEKIGIAGPFKWIAGIEGVKGLGLYYPPPKGRSFMMPGPFGTCVADVVSEEGTMSVGDSGMETLKPFFVKIFAKCGLERPDYLDNINSVG